MSIRVIRREPLNWCTKVHFVYVFSDGSESGLCWRMEYETDAQREKHAEYMKR